MTFTKSMAIALALTATATTSLAMSAQERAAKEYELATAVAAASKEWRDAFNSGDAAGAAALYEEDAVMVAKPFGTFTGREEIQGFWQQIIDGGFEDVVYFNTSTQVTDATLMAAQVSASWKMNKAHGVITNELWVLQPDGSALLREDHFEVAQ